MKTMAVYVPRGTFVRQVFCEHKECMTLTPHHIEYKSYDYIKEKGNFIIMYFKTCTFCMKRDPDTDWKQFETISTNDWDVLVKNNYL